MPASAAAASAAAAAAAEHSSLSVLGFSSSVCPRKNSTLKIFWVTEYLTRLVRLKQRILVLFKFAHQSPPGIVNYHVNTTMYLVLEGYGTV